jgi:valyl-tRNA synthetase
MLDKIFNSKLIEEKFTALWEESSAQQVDLSNSLAPSYTLMMPPPNVTGTLHLGHALTYTLQDILVRYHRMKGFNTLWQPGVDHAGIATQMVVERQLAAEGKNRRDMGREEFLKRVWAWKEESGGTIVSQLKRLGVSADWSRSRFTMDADYSKAVPLAFKTLYDQGLIYQDKRLVNWDPLLGTAVSDLEVETREVKGHLWHLKYPLVEDPESHITVATTRPETLFGDMAVAVNPEDPRYQGLIGKMVRLPLCDREIPIIGDEHSDPSKGTGAVKITPAHDFNDFEVGKRHSLPLLSVTDNQGRLNDQVPCEFQGLTRERGRAAVLEALEALGLMEKADPIIHGVPHGDRSGVPIEPWLTDQWYVDAKTLAQPALKAVEEGMTVFVPENWTETYYDWLRNIQPWCISRQIWWGHRIPAWYGPDKKVFVALDEAEAQEMARLHYGKEVPLRQDEDVLDTWFSSGMWPFCTLGWPEQKPELEAHYPTSMLVTGFDIIFFWVARMMMMGLHFMGKVPFKTVYIHALVRDEKGQKMSKSKGNVIDPLDLINAYGADAVRFTLASQASWGRDIKMSSTRVEGYRNFITKLWNAGRYCQMNECTWVPSFDPLACVLPVNQWAVLKITALRKEVEKALAAYKFNEAAYALYHGVWGTFCDWYLEFTKPILLAGEAHAGEETRQTIAWMYAQLLHLLHPFIPFVTEALADSFLSQPGSLLISASWPEDLSPALTEAKTYGGAEEEMDWLIRLISQIRGVRGDLNVPAPSLVSARVMGSSPETQKRLQTHKSILLKMARLESLTVDERKPEGGEVMVMVEEARFFLSLRGVIDFKTEAHRLQKEIEKWKGEESSLKKRLENPQFVEKASEEVVTENKDRLEKIQKSIAHLQTALAYLK